MVHYKVFFFYLSLLKCKDNFNGKLELGHGTPYLTLGLLKVHTARGSHGSKNQ